MPDRNAAGWEDDGVDPAEAFALLADADRFAILGAIAEADETPLSFNDLYERSAFDDSGQFNYHLDKLVGTFVRKTEGGYRLRHAARIAYRLAVSGLFSDRGEVELGTAEGSCLNCGTDALTTAYEGDRFWVRCEACGRRVAVGPFPPRALANHGHDRAPAAFDRYTTGTVTRAVANVCPWCASPLAASVEPAGDDWPTVDWVVRRQCGHCHGWIYTRLSDLLRFHPAVVAFYHERGVDVLGSTFWEADLAMADRTVDAASDEWAVTVTLACEGDEIELGVADDARVSTTAVLSTTTDASPS